MDITELKNEINTDSLGRGYDGMTDLQVVESLNDVLDRVVNKAILTGSEIFNAINKAELNGKTSEEKQQVWNIVHLGDVNPFGLEADLFIDIFGGSSVTITTLQALRKTNISRATELGLGIVVIADIEDVRRGE